VGKIPAIAPGADAMLGITGEYGADFDFLNPCLFNFFDMGFSEFSVSPDNKFIRIRVTDIFLGDPA